MVVHVERLSGVAELLDGPIEPELLAGNLRDLELVNRWLGGQDLSWRALAPLLGEPEAAAGLRLLDVGTGGGDIPRALLHRARQAGQKLEIAASDVRDEVLEIARRRLVDEPAVALELASPERLQHPDGAFEVVHASLLLHHLEPQQAAALLAEMSRLASRAVIVNDLFRRWHAWLGAWLLTRIATRNRYTRHDGPLSVRRAYQPAEIARLAEPAGLRPERLLREPLGQRYALVLRPAGRAER
jgi:ubiquinone/menaquinone biosynthesis C-methylase UbiE